MCAWTGEKSKESSVSVDLSAIPGQSHMKCCFLWFGIESDRAKMLLDDSLHGIQPQPQSLTEGFCRKEGLEDMIGKFRRNSVPGIGDLDKNRLALQLGGQGERARITHRV